MYVHIVPSSSHMYHVALFLDCVGIRLLAKSVAISLMHIVNDAIYPVPLVSS